MKRTSDALCGAILLALGGAIAVEARRIPDPGADVIGPAAFPFVLGLMVAACGAALCVKAAGAGSAAREAPSPGRWLVLGAILALLVAYTDGLGRLGFLPTTALFVTLCLALLGKRGPVRLMAAGVAVSLAIFVIFGLALGVDLPKGRLFAG
jgi:putative tricarboxylic transport membrane protein